MALPETPPPKAPSRLALHLRAREDFGGVYKQTLIKAFKLTKSAQRATDLAHEGLIVFLERADSLGIDENVPRDELVGLIEAEVVRAHDRARKRAELVRRAPMTQRVLDTLGLQAPTPESALAEAQAGALWTDLLARTAALAAPYPCAKILIDAVIADDDDPGARAREAGFDGETLKAERKRLKRLGRKAALAMKLGVGRDDEDDTEEERSP